MRIYIREEWVRPALIGTGAFLVGTGVGWIARQKKFERDFIPEEVVIDEDPQQQFKFEETVTIDVQSPRIVVSSSMPTVQAEDAAAALVDYQAMSRPDTPAEKRRQALADLTADPAGAGWDAVEEEAGRTKDAPYILHHDEFHGPSVNDYRQSALTYYAGDDVLTDDKNVPIPRPGPVVGKLEFGRGSKDPDIVYIRNDELESEFEVTRVDGSYTTEVLGIEAEEAADEAELKHSQRIPKFNL